MDILRHLHMEWTPWKGIVLELDRKNGWLITIAYGLQALVSDPASVLKGNGEKLTESLLVPLTLTCT